MTHRPNPRGLWVTLEGGDGTGKTTQADHARRFLTSIGRDAIRTREPGGTPLGDKLRHLILTEEMGSHTEALLFAANRADHIRTFVDPALAAGTDVVQDRYIDSSIAYQGYGRDLDPAEVRQVNMWATGGALPELTILLDLDPAIAATRVSSRGEQDRIEQEQDEFRVRLRAGFLTLAAAEPDRFVIIDASDSEAQVAGRVRSAITNRLLAR
jgi:dTMP kinase